MANSGTQGPNSSAPQSRVLRERFPTFRRGSLLALLPLAVAASADAAMPQPAHVVVVVMENHSYDDIIGIASAPYINSLAAEGASFSQSFAIEHPSQPNYLDLFSGSNQGVTDDSCPHTFSTDNLGSQMIAAGFSFAGYSETLPAAGSTVCTSGSHGYARKHSPWVNFSNLATTTNQPFTAFPQDFASLPTLSFVIPNLCHDMHDCSIATGDAWLEANIDAYAQWARGHDSVLVVTWDEDDYSQSNQIATIFCGALVIPGSYAGTIDHYSVLATLEAMYGLDALGGAATREPIADIWDTTLFRNGFD